MSNLSLTGVGRPICAQNNLRISKKQAKKQNHTVHHGVSQVPPGGSPARAERDSLTSVSSEEDFVSLTVHKKILVELGNQCLLLPLGTLRVAPSRSWAHHKRLRGRSAGRSPFGAGRCHRRLKRLISSSLGAGLTLGH